jgi:hypothetical protein
MLHDVALLVNHDSTLLLPALLPDRVLALVIAVWLLSFDLRSSLFAGIDDRLWRRDAPELGRANLCGECTACAFAKQNGIGSTALLTLFLAARKHHSSVPTHTHLHARTQGGRGREGRVLRSALFLGTAHVQQELSEVSVGGGRCATWLQGGEYSRIMTNLQRGCGKCSPSRLLHFTHFGFRFGLWHILPSGRR